MHCPHPLPSLVLFLLLILLVQTHAQFSLKFHALYSTTHRALPQTHAQVEAVGMLSPIDIVKEALRILREKSESFIEALDHMKDDGLADDGDAAEQGADDMEGLVQH